MGKQIVAGMLVLMLGWVPVSGLSWAQETIIAGQGNSAGVISDAIRVPAGTDPASVSPTQTVPSGMQAQSVALNNAPHSATTSNTPTPTSGGNSPPPVGTGGGTVQERNQAIVDAMQQTRDQLYREENNILDQITRMLNLPTRPPQEGIEMAFVAYHMKTLERIQAEMNWREAQHLVQTQPNSLVNRRLVELGVVRYNGDLSKIKAYLNRHLALYNEREQGLRDLKDSASNLRNLYATPHNPAEINRKLALNHLVELVKSELSLHWRLVGAPSMTGVRTAANGLQAIFNYNQRLVDFHTQKDEPYWQDRYIRLQTAEARARRDIAHMQRLNVTVTANGIKNNNRPILMVRPFADFQRRVDELLRP